MYGFSTKLKKMPFDTAITKVTEALKKEGFGVLNILDAMCGNIQRRGLEKYRLGA